MMGLMQDYPLVIPKLLNHAAAYHKDSEIVSKVTNGSLHRYTYGDMAKRTKQLANAFTKLGVQAGDKIGTIAWNGYRHIEIYYTAPGMGAVYHTINPRLSPEQLVYVINHAEDKILCVESMFLPLLEAIWHKLESVEYVVVLGSPDEVLKSQIKETISYEAIISDEVGEYDWAEIEENKACGICYTSGTTGKPKGVVYSHRSIVLQSMSTLIGIELTANDIILPIVPMFHVNAWTLPFAAAISGIKLVMPGQYLDGKSIWELMKTERVTFSAGVPTVFQTLLEYMRENNLHLPYLKKVAIGGSAVPRTMLEDFERIGVEALHAWGMTETTSMGTRPLISSHIRNRGDEAVMQARLSQGCGLFGSELQVLDDSGNPLPRDGKTSGRLYVRGWAVSKSYLKTEPDESFLNDGWFDTGDVASIDPDGYMKITDRAKDMVKSGGEWISSIDIENAAMNHPDVQEAAVIGVPHPKWSERPLLIVVPTKNSAPDKIGILNSLDGRVISWWIPEDIEFLSELPHGATGKVSKLRLREIFKDYQFSSLKL